MIWVGKIIRRGNKDNLEVYEDEEYVRQYRLLREYVDNYRQIFQDNIGLFEKSFYYLDDLTIKNSSANINN